MKKILSLTIISFFIFSGCATYPIGSNKWWSKTLGKEVIKISEDYADSEIPRAKITTTENTMIF